MSIHKKIARLTLLFLIAACSSFAQGTRKDDIALTSVGNYLVAVPNASIRICIDGAVGVPCSPVAPVYSNPSLTTPLPNPFTADANGNYFFYALAANYVIQVTTPGGVYTQNDVTLPNLPKQVTTTFNYVPVAFSTAPAFNFVPNTMFKLVLTGNVLSSTLVGNPAPGNVAMFSVCQDTFGGHAFNFPPNFVPPVGFTVDLIPTHCNNLIFAFDGSNWEGVGGGGSGGSSFYQTVQLATVPVTQRSILNFLSPFTVTDDPGNSSTDIGLPTLFYQTIQSNAVSLPQETKWNAVPPFTCVDNAGNTRTDCSIPVVVGAGAGHASGLVPDPGAVNNHLPFCQNGQFSSDCQVAIGTLPNPVVSGSLSNGAPWNLDVDIHPKGPNPWFDITRFGGYIGPNFNTPTTGNITGGVNTLALASALDFLNGQGLLILGAGPAPTIATPTGVTAAAVGVTGTNTNFYCVLDEDYFNGRTPCSSAGSVTNTVATLGLQATTLTAGSRVSGIVTMTTSAAHNYHVNNQVDILRGSTVGTNASSYEGSFTVTAIPDSTHFQFTQYGLPDDASLTAGTARMAAKVNVSWNAPVSNTVLKHIIYRCTTAPCTLPANAANYIAAGVATGNDSYWVDHGYTLTCSSGLLTNVDNGDAPCTAPTVASNQWFPTSITGGGGSTSLTLAANATNTVSNAQVRHDNTPSLNAACAALISGGTIVIPATPNNTYEFPISSVFNMPTACSKQVEIDFGTEVWATAPIIPKGASQLKGTASGTVTQFPNFTGVSNIVWFNGFAYPFIFMESSVSSNLGLNSMQFACNQTDQSCIYQDAGTTGAGSVSIRYDDVYPIAGTQSTAYVVKGGFSYYWYGGGWTASPADFSGPPAALFTLNCGTGQTGQLLPAQFYSDKTFAFGGVLMDSCNVTPSGAGGGGGMEFRGMIAESNFGPMFRFNTPNAGIAAIDFYFPEYADFLGGQNVPLIDITNVATVSGIRVIHPLCATGGQPVFQTNTSAQYQLEVVNQTQGCNVIGSNYYRMSDDLTARSVLSNYTQVLIGGAESIYQMATPGPAQSVVISAGGSIPLGAHGYTITAVDFNGHETIQSMSVSGTATSGNQTATITLPAVLPVGATGFNVYRDGALTNLNTCLIPQFTTPGGTAVDTSATRCGAIPQVATQAGSTILDQNGILVPQIRMVPFALSSCPTGLFCQYEDPTTLAPFGRKGSTIYQNLFSTGAHTVNQSVCFSDTTTGFMVPCTGGAGNVNNSQQFSLTYYSGAGSTNTLSGSPGPTGPNGVAQIWITIPSGGVATQPIPALAGLPGRTNTTASDAVIATDRNDWLDETFAGAVAGTISSTIYSSGFAFKMRARGSGSVVTLTPSSGTCNGLSTCQLLQGQNGTFSSIDGTNLIGDIHDATIIAGTNITLTRSDFGLTINASTGTVSTTGSPVNGNLAKFSGSASITNTDLSGDATTAGTSVVTVPKVNGTSYPAGGALTPNTVPVVTGVAAVTYEIVPAAALVGGGATTVNGITCTLGSTCDLGNGVGTARGVMIFEGAGTPFNTTAVGLANQVLQSRAGGSNDPNWIGFGDLTVTDSVVAAGSLNAFTGCPSPAMANNNAGKQVWILPNNANTTSNPTYNNCAIGAQVITKFGTAALAPNDLLTTAWAHLVSDGTHWQLLNPATAASASSLAWSSLTGASAALVLPNAGNATTFQQTSAVNWSWTNTTAATSGTSQSSPIFNLIGNYWNGAAGAPDTWTIQNVDSNGTNAASTLSLVHLAGSSGLAAVSLPTLELGLSSAPSSLNVGYTNAAGGTTNGLIAKLNGTSNTIVTVTTADTEALGIVLTGAGTSGTAEVAISGAVACTFDNTTTAGHYVQISPVTTGNCRDVGSGVPTTGSIILGRVIDGGAAGTHQVALAITPPGSTGGGIPKYPYQLPIAVAQGSGVSIGGSGAAATLPGVTFLAGSSTVPQVGAQVYAAGSTGSQYVDYNIILPITSFTTVDSVTFKVSNDTDSTITHNDVMFFQYKCFVDGATEQPTYAAAQTATGSVPSATGNTVTLTLSTPTITGCSAGNVMFIRIGSSNSSTYTGNMLLYQAKLEMH